MIPDMGPHATFIWASYALMAAVLAGLTIWLILDGRRQAQLLADSEARAGKRRGSESQ
jgi:heme exporter protein D